MDKGKGRMEEEVVSVAPGAYGVASTSGPSSSKTSIADTSSTGGMAGLVPLPGAMSPATLISYPPSSSSSGFGIPRFRKQVFTTASFGDEDHSDAATIATTTTRNEQWEDDDEESVGGLEAVKRWTLRVGAAVPPATEASWKNEFLASASTSTVIVERPTRSPSPPGILDPEVFSTLVATLDHADQDMITEFVEGYTGSNLADAVYERIRVVQESRLRSNSVPGQGWEWEEMSSGVEFDRGSLQAELDSLVENPRVPFDDQESDGRVFSEEADQWRNETAEGDVESVSIASDWIILDEDQGPKPSLLKTLPKSILISILIYSGNPNLLKICKRLSKAPIPDQGEDLAKLVVAFIQPQAASKSGSPDDSMDPAFLLPRCAHASFLNRNTMSLPCLARLLGPKFIPTHDTLGAVLEIAARGKRWNTVLGALKLARHGVERSKGRVSLQVSDLDSQHRRRHFFPNSDDSVVDNRSDMLFISMVSNVVANHGGQLGCEFFKDLTEEGVAFSTEVIEHCQEKFELQEAVVTYLKELFGSTVSTEDSIDFISSRLSKLGLE
ncbi:hypothetical protein HDU97_001855 [Phlyctochytrium planicorne]|nr:hypothetical protein HDU97_001855 [Phlyctochytrium planicorne]